MAHKSEEIVLRRLLSGDAEAAADLSTQLGYPVNAAAMRTRIEALEKAADRAAFAAMLGETLAGWADANVEQHLQSEAVVNLGGLVVKDGLRGLGIGRLLCQAVEAWAVQLGIARVRVRSQIKREDAHRFYLRDGYEQVKTSLVFEKEL